MAFAGRRLLQLNAYDRHKLLVNQYLLTQPGSTSKLQRNTSGDKTDFDVIAENHRFLWGDDESSGTWGEQLAKKYYDKLFKEYAICDLSRYKENKVALRWRIESEVVSGKGQFSCGNKACGTSEELRSWEVNFAYREQGEKKNALVKLRLCPPCSKRLNYHHQKREVKRLKKQRRSGSSSRVSEEGSSTETMMIEEPAAAAAVVPVPEKQVDEAELWRQAGTNTSEERSRDEEFQEFLDELFM